MSDERTRFDLTPEQVPTAWFNLVPDMVAAGMQPLPPLSPQTMEPIGPADLAPIFPEALIMQEVSAEPWIDVPGAGSAPSTLTGNNRFLTRPRYLVRAVSSWPM